MKLSVIIVNYNVQYFLENCLHSALKATQEIDSEIIVVDNNSVDGSQKMMEEKFPSVKLIANKDNKGFSKANNQAIKIAKGEFVLLLNPDTVVEESTFKVCLDFFEQHTDAGGIGVKMLDGKGNFLAESKRGLPTPAVAFYKIFGLAQLFPKSKRFGQYHLGHLSKEETHEVEILSGAFMMIRKAVLDQIGLLDEKFFMYGEDIDLSYRITEAGYKNYYLADTSIIHYKGESTKKSSINYVFVFYRAMAIFAKKHFSSTNAKTFALLINMAIYLRAAVAIISRTLKHVLLPVLDAAVILLGSYSFMYYYEINIKNASDYYATYVDQYGLPILSLIFVAFFYMNHAYRIPTKFKDILNGVLSGSLAVLIAYSMLDETYRFSRAIVLFSVFWAVLMIPFYRSILHFFKIRTFKRTSEHHLAIIGKGKEIERISNLIKDTFIAPASICYINADKEEDGFPYDAKNYQLHDMIDIYGINEIIFCSKDIQSSEIIRQMANLSQTNVDFKIAPAESLYIIGSSSNEDAGKYYIKGTNTILKANNQQNKRLLEVILSLFFILFSPLFIWFTPGFSQYFINMWNVLIGKISFVGIASEDISTYQDSRLQIGILTPLDSFNHPIENEETKNNIYFDYIREYNIKRDLEIIFSRLRYIGRKIN